MIRQEADLDWLNRRTRHHPPVQYADRENSAARTYRKGNAIIQDGSDSSIPSAVDELLYQLAPPTWRTGPRLQRIGGDAEGAGWEGWLEYIGVGKVCPTCQWF